ncbi:kinase binding protein CGI-121-domain-containing protein [Trametes maxima]|nr:kinase binding protein CGI-121-domain-containing protein [Trametes maxima]
MQTFRYSHLPHELSTVHIALYKNVANSAALRSRIVRASQLEGPEGDAEHDAVNFAFIDALLICSLLYLQTAAQRSLCTKTAHSEILWALNPMNNITEAIQRYGVAEVTTSLIVVRIGLPDLDKVEERIGAVMDGTLSPLCQLAENTGWVSIERWGTAVKEGSRDPACEKTIIDEIVTSSVVMQRAMA